MKTLSRRSFIKTGALFVPTLILPRKSLGQFASFYDKAFIANSSGQSSPVLPMDGWWKADAITGNIVNGTIASYLPDSSGNGNTAAPNGGAGAIVPWVSNKQNGLPALDFTTAVNPSINLSSSPGPNLGSSFTLFLVYQLIDGAEHSANQSASSLYVVGSLSNQYAFYNGHGWFGSVATTVRATLVTIKQIGGAVGGSGTYQRVNGATAASNVAANPTAWNSKVVFAEGQDANGLNGYWFETIAYARVLSDSDITATESYLTKKWNIV